MGKLNMVMTVAKEQVSIFDMSKPQSTGTSRADIHRAEKEKTDEVKTGEEKPADKKADITEEPEQTEGKETSANEQE